MGVFNNPVRATVIKAGYGTAKKARNTLKRLRLRHISHKKAHQIARTMYYRAKFHKYQTKNMKEAMKVYEKYLGIDK